VNFLNGPILDNGSFAKPMLVCCIYFLHWEFLLSGGGCEDHIYRLFEEAQVPLPNRLLVRQMDTLQAMVAEGLGVSLVPSLTLVRKPRSIRAIRLVPRQYRTIGVLLATDAVPSPALSRWLDLVRTKAPVVLRETLTRN
jgi:DNA-binding transcriptional LysR family regulator